MPKLSELVDTDYLPAAEPIPADIPRVYIGNGNAPVEQPLEMPSPASSKINSIINALFRDDDKRYQLWPEKVIREGLSGAHDVMEQGTNLGLRREDVTDIPKPDMPTKDSTWLGQKLGIAPVAASPQDSTIEKAQAISALAGTGGLGGTDKAVGMSLGVVPVNIAKKLKFETGKPNDVLKKAVDNTPNAYLDPDGHLVIGVSRRQMPDQEMAESVRGGVFYLPEGNKGYSYTGKNGYGGSQKVEGETAFKNPLVVKGATGGKAPERAYNELMGDKNAYQNMRTEALRALGQGKTDEAKVYSFLEKYAPEMSDYASYIIQNSKDGNKLPYALQEAAVASAARKAGHDGVVGYSTKKDGSPFLSEIFDVRENRYPSPSGEYSIHPELYSDSKVGTAVQAVSRSGPFLRPALKYKDRLYKGKEGQGHQDVIPDALYPEFQKMAMSGEDISHYNFGFVNDKGHFLNREDALKYGIDTGIIDPQAGKFGALTSTLMADSSKPGTAIEAMAKTQSPAFFSALEHNVSKISQNKMTGDQWLGTLSNKPGVKPEEMQWTGLGEFLKENGNKPVTKAQIEEHLAGNKVELKEVSKGAIQDPIVRYLKDDYQTTKEIRNSEDIANAKKYNASFKETVKGMTDEEILKAARAAENVKDLGDTKYHSYQLPGGPLSRDTEILTNKGWKRIDAVEIGDVVMTRKDEAGILEWQPVQATPKVYAENLYHFFSQSINMRVTENHQMIAKKRRRSSNEELLRLTAKELWGMSEMLVPLTGVWTGGETDNIFGFDPHDLAELFGWYLAEGSYKHKNGNKHTIQIAQCKEYNPEKCERIEALLDRMSLPWRYYGQAYGIGTKTLNKDLAELFHEQPTSEFKFVPYFFFNQSKSVIQSLLDGLILGDGCASEQEGRLDKTTFFTNSEQLAGDVQILILMTGKNANVRQRPSGLYYVGIKSKEWSSIDDAKFEIAPYNDFAFCVTVENHAIYVRRNGVAAFTGNSNYREMLLTLPGKTGPKAQYDKVTSRLNKIQDEFNDLHLLEGLEKAPANIAAQRKSLADEAVKLGKERSDLEAEVNRAKNSNYKSSHWDEPNILAHVRMNDRTIDGKKSLHLEEIQSDWHQQGRDKGYRPEQEKKLAELIKQREDLQKEASALGSSDARYKEIYKELPTIQTKINEIGSGNVGVPDAPFKKSWHELALKRMIREAAEKGYDRLSWTPGEAQAARYDLSKSVEKLAYNPDSGHLQAYNKDNRLVMDQPNVGKDKLSDYIGKEAAKKILEAPNAKAKDAYAPSTDYHLLEGQDLKIGGEGMKGFYDQIIPKALEKLGKEHGAKVKQDIIRGHQYKGYDSYEAGQGPSGGNAVFGIKPDGKKVVINQNYSDMNAAKEAAKNLNSGGEASKVHYIDIPQSMRDAAMHKGFPLFSSTHMFTPVDHEPEFKKK